MWETPATSISREATLGEEIANSISHGLLLAAAGLPILVVSALRSGSCMWRWAGRR
jgi:hemolysin III